VLGKGGGLVGKGYPKKGGREQFPYAGGMEDKPFRTKKLSAEKTKWAPTKCEKRGKGG